MDTKTTQIDWLRGIKVLLIGSYVPGPLAAYLLRSLGAEVIKVEDAKGDPLRQIGTFSPETAAQTSPMFHMLHAGFKGLGLQYRKPEGARILQKLIAQVDIVIDGNRAGALERYLGAPVQSFAPHIIYVPITAYGQVGPMAGLAGHDNNILAMAGNLSYTQNDAEGAPTVFSSPVADIFAGQMAAMGALAAIIGRGAGPDHRQAIPTIDASMLHAGFFLNLLELAARNDAQPQIPTASKAWMNGGRPDYLPYRCSDGKFIFFGLIESWAAKRFFIELGREDLAAYLGAPALLGPALKQLFVERTQAEWVHVGSRHDACITAVNDLEQAIQDPQIQALGRMQIVNDPDFGDLHVPSFPLGFGPESLAIQSAAQAPMLGEHNVEILQQMLFMTLQEMDVLIDQEILVQGKQL